MQHERSEEPMPERATKERAKKAMRKGAAPSSAGGEFIREEMHHIREGKHGARSTKQAIAIGLSKARRAGFEIGTPKGTPKRVRKQAARDNAKGRRHAKPSRTRSRATLDALKQEPRASASHKALSRHAKTVARKRTRKQRSASARKAARTRARRARS
jgi:hypothetical protein